MNDNNTESIDINSHSIDLSLNKSKYPPYCSNKYSNESIARKYIKYGKFSLNQYQSSQISYLRQYLSDSNEDIDIVIML